jgi:hypothetical protein
MKEELKEQIKNELPYGEWELIDGSTVLFNRYYKPLNHLSDKYLNPDGSVNVNKDFVETRYYYKDGENPPWKDNLMRFHLKKLLERNC